MAAKPIRIGTRGSNLALAQTAEITDLLQRMRPDIPVETVIIKTAGDTDQVTSLAHTGEPGFFTKKIEAELLAGRIDVAVHSAKDLPSQSPDGLMIAAVPVRGPLEDVWVSVRYGSLDEAESGTIVGTGSPRRRALLLNHRGDLKASEIRGNVETRLRKLQEGRYDALIMARAGLARLGLNDRISEILPCDLFVPAAGQGALAIQIRVGDGTTERFVRDVNDPASYRSLAIERLLLRRLNAGCSVALGAYATITDTNIKLSATVLDKDGCRRLYATYSLDADQTNEELVDLVSQSLILQGALQLIKECDG